MFFALKFEIFADYSRMLWRYVPRISQNILDSSEIRLMNFDQLTLYRIVRLTDASCSNFGLEEADPLVITDVCLSVCLSVCLFVCLSVCLSVCRRMRFGKGHQRKARQTLSNSPNRFAVPMRAQWSSADWWDSGDRKCPRRTNERNNISKMVLDAQGSDVAVKQSSVPTLQQTKEYKPHRFT
jgi:hypothetical protein